MLRFGSSVINSEKKIKLTQKTSSHLINILNQCYRGITSSSRYKVTSKKHGVIFTRSFGTGMWFEDNVLSKMKKCLIIWHLRFIFEVQSRDLYDCR